MASCTPEMRTRAYGFLTTSIISMRCLLTDILFPAPFAQWRLVEITSFIDRYDTDILVTWTSGVCGMPTLDGVPNADQITSRYDIIIFNPAYRDLERYNDPGFKGMDFAGTLPGYDFMFRLKKFRHEERLYPHGITLSSYSFVYNIFMIGYLNFNEVFKNCYPQERQYVHYYPGGNDLGRFPKHLPERSSDSQWIVTNPLVLDTALRVHPRERTHALFGGPFFYENEPLYRKPYVDGPITICFTTLVNGEYRLIQKGSDVFCRLASELQGRKDIRLVSVGGCLPHDNITHYPAMTQSLLTKFYQENVDVYLNLALEKPVLEQCDGFPLGTEAAREGVVLLTTNPHDANRRSGFDIDDFHIISRNDIQGIVDKIVVLTDKEKRRERGMYIQSKVAELFGHERQMKSGVFRIIEETLPV